MKKNLKYILIPAIYIAVWSILSASNDLFFPGPYETAKQLYKLLMQGTFYEAVFNSAARTITGFVLTLIAAFVLSAAAVRYSFIRDLLGPVMLLFKSVPVACLSILVIIWFGSGKMAFFVVIMVSLPVLYMQLLLAARSVDADRKSLGRVYGFSKIKYLRVIYLPVIRKPLRSAVRLAVSMSFKAGIAAELIGLSEKTIGERLYMTKLYFETGELFAWVIVILVISYASELLISTIVDRIILLLSGYYRTYNKKSVLNEIDLKGVCVAFDGQSVLKNIDLTMDVPGFYAVCGRSGRGKTTFFNVIAGLKIPDRGSVKKTEVSYSFQSINLISYFTAIENIAFLGGRSREEAELFAEKLLDRSLFEKKAEDMSGGEQRRVQVACALAYDRSIILLDEPFSGLDELNIKKMIELIRVYAEDHIVLISEHEEERALMYGAGIINLENNC